MGRRIFLIKGCLFPLADFVNDGCFAQPLFYMRKSLLENTLVIDIETASAFPDFDSMEVSWQLLWYEKIKGQLTDSDNAASFYSKRAGVLAEFGRIVCIGLGKCSVESKLSVDTQLFYDTNELILLKKFLAALERLPSKGWRLAGHNIREFDIPFICRRLLIHGLPIPDCLNVQGVKPWDNPLIDTFQFWRFGDYKHYTSLALLAKVLGLPNPKNEMDGSMVGALFWEKDPIRQALNLKRIAAYCENDVRTTAQVVYRLMQQKKLPIR